MSEYLGKPRLTRKLDRVYVHFENGEQRPAKLVWAKPISGMGREISIIDDDKKEIHMLKSLDCLDPESREIAAHELEQRYLVPKITRVDGIVAAFGNRYWDVRTDRGERRFVMKDPTKNVIRVRKDQLILRDTLGNRYEIESLAHLDTKSRYLVEQVI